MNRTSKLTTMIILLILSVAFFHYNFGPGEARHSDIQMAYFKIADDNVLFFIRDHFPIDGIRTTEPFFLLIKKNLSLFKFYKLPVKFVESNRLSIYSNEKKDKLWLFSPSIDEIIFLDIDTMNFKSLKRDSHFEIKHLIKLFYFDRSVNGRDKLSH